MFREQADTLGISLTVRSYSRTPGMLERRFFEDWLGVPVPNVAMPSAVNPSLTLSELALIRQMAQTRPALVESLYSALIDIPTEDKVQGEAMERYSRAVAAAAVARHRDEWQAWNERLPGGEQLVIPDAPDEIPPRPQELGFSEVQLAAIAAVLGRAATPGFVAGLAWRQGLRPRLGRLKRAVLGT